jgi:hypothetical protein
MAVKRGTALKSKSSLAFIWYLLAWFTFRTLPFLYFKVASNAEAVAEPKKETVEQKKWGSKVRTALYTVVLHCDDNGVTIPFGLRKYYFVMSANISFKS